MRAAALLVLLGGVSSALALDACVGDSPTGVVPVADGGAKDTSVTDGPVPACDNTKNWATPVMLGGVNSNAVEADPTLTSDELTIIFSSTRLVNGSNDFNFWIAQRASKTAPFNAPNILEPITANGINTTADDHSGTLTGDGLKFIFRSNRGGNSDLYQVTRATQQAAFAAPVSLTDLNTPADELGPSVTSNGARLVFQTTPVDGGSTAFFEATPNGNTWAKKPLAGDFLGNDSDLVLANDGLHAYVASGRPTSAGFDDIWSVMRPALDQPFVVGNNLVAINSAAVDRPSWISPDGCHLYFWSGRGGNAHIYYVERLP